MVSTSIDAIQLLLKLQAIETCMGRTTTTRNGPRAIDLDILFYGNSVIDKSDLTVPHPRMEERFFVLAPLRDIAPNFLHPVSNLTVSEIFDALQSASVNTCIQVTPNGLPDGVFPSKTRSIIMGILNVTPDSFSDGGLYTDCEEALQHARNMVQEGADIIDVGGESTRPSAELIDAELEIARVVNIIKRIRDEFPLIPISIDTYKAATARAAVAAGACIINDVSGGLLDSEMLEAVSQLGVPYICMHAGRVGTQIVDHVDGRTACLDEDTSTDEVICTLHTQLELRAQACMARGIPRWDIVLDPGLGFGKSGRVNFDIVRNMDKIFSKNIAKFPIMIGASRKRFVRDLEDGKSWKGSNRDAMAGTAAVTVACIASSLRVLFHRVHDVSELRRVVDVADRIYRCA
jgi:dihydroneopterin aldolase/2-amino-4-hydroxy-6-hydroxymethyldihydropteridine diphosphokinase/dihydropteroate synthase/2-amino-4-hydroxy-6-hydroxymethyldihydropteridine diphosphokinase/dihydropteroate synthase